MQIIKTEYRATLSGDHLEQSLRLAVGNYSPDYGQRNAMFFIYFSYGH